MYLSETCTKDHLLITGSKERSFNLDSQVMAKPLSKSSIGPYTPKEVSPPKPLSVVPQLSQIICKLSVGYWLLTWVKNPHWDCSCVANYKSSRC